MQLHISGGVITAKDTGEPILEGHDGAIENAVGAWNGGAGEDWVPFRTPNDFMPASGGLFPGDVAQFGSNQTDR
jgi:hypothetical protein